MFILLVNGPPRSGKDTVADLVFQITKSSRKMKFASPLKKAVHASFSLMVPEDHFELVKEQPRDEFYGLTPRQAYINHSEKYMKPLYGKDIYGRLMLRQLEPFSQKHGPKFIVIADCGFQEEVDTVCRKHPCLLFRMHREGCDFSNDSRGYIRHENMIDVPNNGTTNDLRLFLHTVLNEFKLI